MDIKRKECSCQRCLNYSLCKGIEERFRDSIIADRGNWREIYDKGRRVGTPIRRCSHAILKSSENVFFNKRVLEIGCGPLSGIDRKFCQDHNMDYVGLDPERLPVIFIDTGFVFLQKVQKRLISYILHMFNVKKYRLNRHQYYIRDTFPLRELKAEEFEVIYGNSTIEHWHQKEVDIGRSAELYNRDIDECYRLLTHGGIMLMNCPIYVHGNMLFMQGKVDIIERIFENANWRKVTFEYWRRNHHDLMPYCPERRKEYFYKEFGIDLENIWLLNVVAEK